jgi:hypothetical protein
VTSLGADAVAEQERNVDTLVVPIVGRVEEVTDGLVPYRLVDAAGVELAAVTEFLRDVCAGSRGGRFLSMASPIFLLSLTSSDSMAPA